VNSHSVLRFFIMTPVATETIQLDINPDDWAGALGRKFRARQESLAGTVHSAHERSEQLIAAQARWVPIVEAIKRLVAGYNAGASHEVLKVVEELSTPDGPMIRIGCGGEGEPFLTATLEGTLICLRMRDGQGVLGRSECQLHSDRNDDRTAAYLMQNWLTRL
jgi:hypothetical protein